MGLVITDEQHRFGVNQRKVIGEKGKNVDKIVMTATPIPRTLALILYGDLDISVIDELPPNRKKIETFAVPLSMEDRVNNFIKEQIKLGRQGYIVCPLVEENEEIDAKSVLELFEKYKTQVFSEFRVEYIHGKLKQKEKDQIMEEFKDGKIDILISTTVIEVRSKCAKCKCNGNTKCRKIWTGCTSSIKRKSRTTENISHIVY